MWSPYIKLHLNYISIIRSRILAKTDTIAMMNIRHLSVCKSQKTNSNLTKKKDSNLLKSPQK